MNGQVSLQPHGVFSAEDVFDALRPTLVETISANSAAVSGLSIRVNKSGDAASIVYVSSPFCRLYIRKEDIKITIPPDLASGDTQFTISIKDDLLSCVPSISHALDHLIDSLPLQFDCCSRYQQCSDARKCISPDPSLAVGCRYRRNLKAGKVFYRSSL